MATDIHGHIEICDRSDAASPGSWFKAGICLDDMWQERIPGIFWRLMGEPDGNGDCVPMRGFPSDASLDTLYDYGYRVADVVKNDPYLVSYFKAKKWIKEFGCSYFKHVSEPYERFINNPDWHHPGWVNADEIERCIVEVFGELDKCKSVAFEWWVLLNVMRLYESNPNYEVRYVFWFDN